MTSSGSLAELQRSQEVASLRERTDVKVRKNDLGEGHQDQ